MATNGLVVMTPSSIVYSGTSASINADGSVDFSAVTSLSLNDVFTGDYDNYMIVARTQNSGILTPFFGRWRASGTDESSGSDYYTRQYLLANANQVEAARSNSSYIYMALGSTLQNGFVTYIYGPYLSQPTAGRTVAVDSYLDAQTFDVVYTHSLSNSYDGISFRIISATMTGLVTVFGFNQ